MNVMQLSTVNTDLRINSQVRRWPVRRRKLSEMWFGCMLHACVWVFDPAEAWLPPSRRSCSLITGAQKITSKKNIAAASENKPLRMWKESFGGREWRGGMLSLRLKVILFTSSWQAEKKKEGGQREIGREEEKHTMWASHSSRSLYRHSEKVRLSLFYLNVSYHKKTAAAGKIHFIRYQIKNDIFFLV